MSARRPRRRNNSLPAASLQASRKDVGADLARPKSVGGADGEKAKSVSPAGKVGKKVTPELVTGKIKASAGKLGVRFKAVAGSLATASKSSGEPLSGKQDRAERENTSLPASALSQTEQQNRAGRSVGFASRFRGATTGSISGPAVSAARSSYAASASGRDVSGNIAGKGNWQGVLSSRTDSRMSRYSRNMIAIVIFLVLAVIIVVPPLRSYIIQQEELRALNAEITQYREQLDELTQQRDLWNNSNYVQSQARERLGFVMPGEVLYKVIGTEVNAAYQSNAQRVQEVVSQRLAATPFYLTLWQSLEFSGNFNGEQNPTQVPILHIEKEKFAQIFDYLNSDSAPAANNDGAENEE